jgi:hypothetical protein
MGQQPNIGVSEQERPRRGLQPPPARRWHPDIKPGIPTSPDEVPHGGRFGQTTPDGGYALRLVNSADLPDDDPDLRAVLAALTMARAGMRGRAPSGEDLDVALALCGYGFDAPSEVIERRQRWLAAVPHESRPGHTAVGEIDRELVVLSPKEVRRALSSPGGRQLPAR